MRYRRRSESAPQLYSTAPHTPSPQYRSMVPLNPAGQGFCAVVSDGVSGQSLSGRHCLRTTREPMRERKRRPTAVVIVDVGPFSVGVAGSVHVSGVARGAGNHQIVRRMHGLRPQPIRRTRQHAYPSPSSPSLLRQPDSSTAPQLPSLRHVRLRVPVNPDEHGSVAVCPAPVAGHPSNSKHHAESIPHALLAPSQQCDASSGPHSPVG